MAAGSWRRCRLTCKCGTCLKGKEQRFALNLDVPGRSSNLALSPNGRLVACGVWDGTVKLYDADAGTELRTLRGHTEQVHAVVFSPDSQRLGTGTADQSVILWDVVSGQEALTLPAGLDGFLAVRSSANGHFRPAGWSGTVTVWNGTPLAPNSDVQNR